MNTYLIPTTAAYCYEPYDHIYLVYANTPLEAYRKAQTELQGEYSFKISSNRRQIVLQLH